MYSSLKIPDLRLKRILLILAFYLKYIYKCIMHQLENETGMLMGSPVLKMETLIIFAIVYKVMIQDYHVMIIL